jgi:Leucine-rich repeat (LRR) protein
VSPLAAAVAIAMLPLCVQVVAGCAHAAPRPVVAPPAPVRTEVPPPAPVSPWAAMPVRVMAWTPHGVQPIGAWPGTVPQPMPERWYVEPIARLDEAGLATLVGLVRSEHVPGLSLRNQPVAPWLAALHDLPELAALLLDGTGVDGAALAAMQLSLTRLYLARTAIDDAAVAALVERYPGLEALDVEDTAVGDAGARAIGKLASLRAVNLAGTQLGDDGGAALASLARLEIADLGSTRVGRKTIAALRGLPLRELFLDHTRVRGEIATLAALAPQLVRFDVSSTAHHPTDAELGWLATAPNLIEIGVSGAKVHDALALALVKLPGLRELRMAETAITSATIHAIAARTDLEEVDLADTPVDDASAAALLASPDLRIARLDGTPISDAALAGTAGPRLVELFLSRTSVGDRAMAFLDGAPQLTALGLGHSNIGDGALDRLARLSGLRTLVLSNVHVSSAALARLAALRVLERLYLDQVHVNDEVLAALAPVRETLRVLHLAGSDVSEDGLAALRAFSELEELTIGDTRMHAGIADLSAWPRLRTLSLVGLELTDRVLPSLAARPSLAILDLSATEIRDPSALAALPHLRTLGVAQTRLSPAGVAAIKRLAARGVEVVR